MKKLITLLLLPLFIIPLYGVSSSYPYVLPPLEYSYDALEPSIDAKTMMLHHDKHHATYVANLNKALEPYPNLQKLSLQTLLTMPNLPNDVSTAIHNNGGGHYNHTFFWKVMSPNGGGDPVGPLGEAIKTTYGSYDAFKSIFKQQALATFGSGWVYLLADEQGNLHILSFPNQDTPLSTGFTPLIALDVWEHAYYLKYENRRGEYIDNWWQVVDWSRANSLYNPPTAL